jgi:hypothetical protein
MVKKSLSAAVPEVVASMALVLMLQTVGSLNENNTSTTLLQLAACQAEFY